MTQVSVQRRPDTDSDLPLPPTDVELVWYLGRQHRWLLVFQAFSFAAIAYSMIRFSLTQLDLMLFLIPITLYCITITVSMLSSTRKRRLSLKNHLDRVDAYAPSVFPTVDVFLPTAGEPLTVLANTYDYVSRLDWPHRISVWVLDDSGRSEVEQLSNEYGFNYRSRPNKGHLKKAGNLRYGYDQSDGDYIAIFDADFVPRSDFIHHLIPYFEDSSVGIVQSPQFFDATKKMKWLQRCAGATQELFYRWIQPGRDRSNAAICVGTCAIYRRSALVKSGGFAQIGHSEDVHTGVNMMRVGYYVRYVPIVVSKGLCPETALQFLNQQYRWCTGSMSLLADESFHKLSHISTRQRLCFWSGFLYYISTAINAFVAPLPGLAMIWLLPGLVYPRNSLPLLGAVMLWLVILPMTMKGRWRVDVLRAQMMYSFAHALAIIHLLTGHTKEWVATGSSNSRDTPLAVTIIRTMWVYIGVTQVLIFAGLSYGTYRYGINRFWVMWCFGLLSAYIHVPVLILSYKETRDRRRSQRRILEPLSDESSDIFAIHGKTESVDILPTKAARLSGNMLQESALEVGNDGSTVHSSVAITEDKTATTKVPSDRIDGATAQAPGPRRFRPDIQGLRAVAVTLVVLYHANIPGLTGGYVGVDVFFVISGFLITGQLVREVDRGGRVSLVRFYGGRVRRLLPPAALVIVVTVVANRLWGSIFQVKTISTDAIYTAMYAINYHLAAQNVNYQNANGPQSPLQHFWSLAVEEQFYIVWPLLIMLCVLIARRRRWSVLRIALLTLTAVSIYFSITITKSNAPYAYFSLLTRAWELCIGAIIALYASRLSRLPASIAIGGTWIGVIGIVTTAFVFNAATAFPGSAALWPVACAGIVIACGCRESSGSAELLLSSRPFQGLGRVSYSWYLWHWPMLILIPVMARQTFGWGLNLEICLLALWFAVLTYFLIEKPLQRSSWRMPVWLVGGPATAGLVIAVCAIIVATTPSLLGSGGAASAVVLTSPNVRPLQQALDKAMRERNVPANLEPTLDEAAADQPASTANGCHAGYLTITQGTCVYGDPAGTHTLVLFGDSHAQQWLPAFDLEAQRLHWRVVTWTKAACPIAQVTITSAPLQRIYTECNIWRTQTIHRIESLHPDVVVMSQSDNVPGTQLSNDAWALGTVKTMNILRDAHLPVVYIMDTPIPGSDVPECIAEHLHNATACARSRQHIYAYAGRHQAMAEALKEARVTTLEPVNYFCTSSYCPAIVGNVLVYRDTTHMSTYYSRLIAPMTEPLFVARK